MITHDARILHDPQESLEDLVYEQWASTPTEALVCPNCNVETEETVICPGCGGVRCVERCAPAGVGCLCLDCEEEQIALAEKFDPT